MDRRTGGWTARLVGGWLALAAAAPAAAQSAGGAELVTDRPDVTESSVTVPAGGVQLELGGTVAWDGDSRAASGPGLLVRAGVARGLELRLGLPSWSAGPAGERGFGRTQVEAKLAGPLGGGWAVGVIPFASLPTGTGEARGGGVDAGVVGTWSREIAPRLEVAGNTGASWSGEGGAAWLQTLSLAAGLTERLSGFAEGFATWDPGEAGRPHLDGGLLWLLSPDVQVDLSGGAGVGAARPARWLSLGLSIRR